MALLTVIGFISFCKLKISFTSNVLHWQTEKQIILVSKKTFALLQILILRAGGKYWPIDPKLPHVRVMNREMFDHSEEITRKAELRSIFTQFEITNTLFKMFLHDLSSINSVQTSVDKITRKNTCRRSKIHSPSWSYQSCIQGYVLSSGILQWTFYSTTQAANLLA